MGCNCGGNGGKRYGSYNPDDHRIDPSKRRRQKIKEMWKSSEKEATKTKVTKINKLPRKK